MKRTFFTTFFLVAVCALGAQNHPEPYQLAPDYMQQILAHVIASDCRPMQLGNVGGRYIGHTRNNVFFGWGSYHTDGDNRWVGQWADGKCVFGILIKGNEARVGADKHHIVYDLTRGQPLHIVAEGEVHHFTPAEAEAYPRRFLRLTYEGGDHYIGESINGLPHGQGIYYWSDGSHWYGTFSQGYRQGYGALFGTQGNIDYGLWLGNDKQ